MRMTICRSSRASMLLVGALVAPTIVGAQETTPTSVERSHVVRTGDTLWDLARDYLSDPWQWRQIFDLNRGNVRDPHWIYPGQALRLPGAEAAVARDATATATEPSAAIVAPPAPVADARAALTPTVFANTARSEMPAPPPVMAASSSEPATSTMSAVREGEIIAAPYVASTADIANAGRIVGSADQPGIALTESLRPIQLRERVFVVPPAGVVAQPGDRYLVLAPARDVADVGQVMVPTAVVIVDRVTAGEAVEAHVAAQFQGVLIGQRVTPLSAPALADAPLRAVANGPESRIVWVSGGEVALPTLQNYVVLGGDGAASFRAGDQVTLVRERRTTSEGLVLAETEIALARVVRVSGGAATAIVLRQTAPAIGVGTLARVTARID